MRLTNRVREDIIVNFMRKSDILEREENHVKKRIAFAERIRSYTLRKFDMKKVESAIESAQGIIDKDVPEELRSTSTVEDTVRTSYRILVNLVELKVSLEFNGKRCYKHERDRYKFKETVYKPVPKGELSINSEKFKKQFLDLEQEYHDIEQLIKKYKEEITAVVYGFSSMNALIKAWPKVQELIPEYASAKPVKNLPAIKVDALNAIIGK